jgi:hypothetical protein
MDGCPATLVLTPAFTALAMLMHDAEVQVCDAMNRHALATELASHSHGAGEKIQLAQTSVELP